jgi:hypothetical protein
LDEARRGAIVEESGGRQPLSGCLRCTAGTNGFVACDPTS